MPMWSVTEERVEALVKQMNEKKEEHDYLQKKHIFQLWEDDLDAFEAELTKIEEKEEKDRLMHGGVKNDGKKGKRKAVKAKGGQKKQIKKNEPENEPMINKPAKRQRKVQIETKTTFKPKDPENMTLKERMAAKFGGDLPISSTKSMFSGSDNLSAMQLESMKAVPGLKRSAKETTLFKELNVLANNTEVDDDDKYMEEPMSGLTSNGRSLDQV